MGFRYNVMSTKRTNCLFELMYEKADESSHFFLSKYTNIHNHPLDVEDVYLGQKYLDKVHFLVDEINKRKMYPAVRDKLLNNMQAIENREQIHELDFEKSFTELQQGVVLIEDTDIMKPWKVSSTNCKLFQMDAVSKALAF